MIDIKKLKQLIQLMAENDLSELDLRDREEQVTLKRGVAPAVALAPVAPVEDDAGQSSAKAQPAEADTRGLVEITSPMVGTFYAAASPDTEPYVRVGSSVDEQTVVCLIEAMKVFNEIKAEATGTIEKMLVENGQAVEFGQPLFLLNPH